MARGRARGRGFRHGLPPVRWEAAFDALTPGALVAVPGGLTLTRASSATAQTSASAIQSGIAVDVARVSGVGVPALLFEEARTNYVPYAREVGNGWTLGSTTITANAAAGPDGSALADRVQGASGAFGPYRTFGDAGLLAAATAKVVATIWRRAPNGVTSHGWYLQRASDGAIAANQNDALTTAWERTSLSAVANATGYVFNSCEGRSISPLVAGARDAYLDFLQIEAGSFATSAIVTAGAAATRAGERLYHAAGVAALADGGRLNLEFRFRPLGAATDYGATGLTYPFLWRTSTGQFAYFYTPTRQLAINDGTTELAFTPALSWAAGDTIDLWVSALGGASAAKYRVNGGAAVDLGATASLAAVTGTALDLLCSGTTHQFTSRVERIRAYRAGRRPAWAA